MNPRRAGSKPAFTGSDRYIPESREAAIPLRMRAKRVSWNLSPSNSSATITPSCHQIRHREGGVCHTLRKFPESDRSGRTGLLWNGDFIPAYWTKIFEIEKRGENGKYLFTQRRKGANVSNKKFFLCALGALARENLRLDSERHHS